MKARAGFTLLEVLIAGTLVALLSGIILSFMVAALRQWSMTQEQGDGQMATLLAMHHIQQHLQHSDVSSVYLDPSGTTSGISFLSAVVAPPNLAAGYSLCQALDPNQNPDYTEDGQILWQQRCFYYLDSPNHVLHYVEQPLPAPTTDPAPYRQSVFTPGGRDHVVTGCISVLSFSASDPVPAPNPNIPQIGGAGGLPVVPLSNPQEPVNNPIYVHMEAMPTGELDARRSVKLDYAVVIDNRVPTGGVTLDPNLVNVKRW
ncbi:MAG: PulJ/GspJ family protein [Candidatus Xenobia bacterium]